MGDYLLSSPVAPGTAGAQAAWSEIGALIEALGGVIIDVADLSAAKPVGTLVFNQADSEIYRSTDAVTPTYTQISNTSGGPTFTGIQLVEANGDITNYGTITAALAAASSGDTVLLYAGTYAESVTVPDGVRLRGVTGAQTVKITGSDTTSVRVTLAGASTLFGAQVTAPSSGANPAIDATGLAAFKIAVLNSVVVLGAGGTGPLIAGAGSGQLALLEVYHNGGTTSGAVVKGTSGAITVDTMIPNAGSASAIFEMDNCTLDGQTLIWGPFWSGTAILSLGANADVNFSGIGEPAGTPVVTNGVHITASPVALELSDASIRSTAIDFLVDAAVDGTGSSVRWTGVVARQETFDTPAVWNANVEVTLQYLDNGIENDAVVRVGGGFSVGATTNTASSDFGAGAPVVNTMAVFTDDGTGTAFVDETDDAASRSGSAFNVFQTGGVNDVCYIGAAFPFTDVPFELLTAVTAGGVIEAAVSDGASGWTVIEVMEHDGADSQVADRLFENTGARYLVLGDTTGWATDAVDGTTKYWLRLRVTSALSGAPSAERFRVGRSRSTFTAMGHPIHFGSAAPLRTFWKGNGESLSTPAGGANSPNNADITISTNVSYRQARSRYATGNDERAGTQIEVPEGLLTCFPIRSTLVWTTDGTSTNGVQWDLYVTEIREGDVLNSTTIELAVNSQTLTPSGTAEEVYEADFEFLVPNVVPGDEIGFMLWRRGGTDTNPDAAIALSLAWEGSFWQ